MNDLGDVRNTQSCTQCPVTQELCVCVCQLKTTQNSESSFVSLVLQNPKAVRNCSWLMKSLLDPNHHHSISLYETLSTSLNDGCCAVDWRGDRQGYLRSLRDCLWFPERWESLQILSVSVCRPSAVLCLHSLVCILLPCFSPQFRLVSSLQLPYGLGRAEGREPRVPRNTTHPSRTA